MHDVEESARARARTHTHTPTHTHTHTHLKTIQRNNHTFPHSIMMLDNNDEETIVYRKTLFCNVWRKLATSSQITARYRFIKNASWVFTLQCYA